MTIRAQKERTGRSDSDHYAFMQAKIPALYFGVEDFDQHHKATDDFATITQGFYVRAVETMIAVVRRIRRQPRRSALRLPRTMTKITRGLLMGAASGRFATAVRVGVPRPSGRESARARR